MNDFAIFGKKEVKRTLEFALHLIHKTKKKILKTPSKLPFTEYEAILQDLKQFQVWSCILSYPVCKVRWYPTHLKADESHMTQQISWQERAVFRLHLVLSYTSYTLNADIFLPMSYINKTLDQRVSFDAILKKNVSGIDFVKEE